MAIIITEDGYHLVTEDGATIITEEGAVPLMGLLTFFATPRVFNFEAREDQNA